jgi:hypothetical protein
MGRLAVLLEARVSFITALLALVIIATNLLTLLLLQTIALPLSVVVLLVVVWLPVTTLSIAQVPAPPRHFDTCWPWPSEEEQQRGLIAALALAAGAISAVVSLGVVVLLAVDAGGLAGGASRAELVSTSTDAAVLVVSSLTVAASVVAVGLWRHVSFAKRLKAYLTSLPLTVLPTFVVLAIVLAIAATRRPTPTSSLGGNAFIAVLHAVVPTVTGVVTALAQRSVAVRLRRVQDLQELEFQTVLPAWSPQIGKDDGQPVYGGHRPKLAQRAKADVAR